MSMNSNYNETCPTCGKKHDMHAAFVGHDYQMEFKDECDFCGKEFRVFVHTVPEFETVDEREYQANEKAELQRYRKEASE